MKTYLIAANWKQNGTLKTLSSLTKNIIKFSKQKRIKHKIVLFPPSIYLSKISLLTKKIKNISLGSQDISPYSEGAFTGEISARMIKDFDCKYTIIGHSERRHVFQENDTTLSSKVNIAINEKLSIILCVGETISERKKRITKRVISRQLKTALGPSKKLLAKNLHRLIIAYEPVWAIGTGRNATNEQISDVHKYIKNSLSKIFKSDYQKIKILYGGSVNSSNAKIILSLNEVDGALIGGASLKAKKFIEICSSI
ncbi:MAG: triose-phosphate isomerase [Pseudomonadota bacterium]|nr:triose-phosphate isomerase [Pseudomonadota bacterium]